MRPGGWTQRPRALVIGYLADRLLGEPPDEIHPLRAYGAVMGEVERALYGPRRPPGILYALLGAALGAASGAVVGSLAIASYVALGGQALEEAAARVDAKLRAGDLPAARQEVRALVGRDRDDLDEAELARAVVESLAENTNDAVVAPLWWGLVAGAPGVGGYRALNTSDALVGYRDERYEAFGWASARLDDLAGFVPARATALLVDAVRPGRAGEVLRAVRVDASQHPSPNAGVAEVAFRRVGALPRWPQRLPGPGRGATEARPGPRGASRRHRRGDQARARRWHRRPGCGERGGDAGPWHGATSQRRRREVRVAPRRRRAGGVWRQAGTAGDVPVSTGHGVITPPGPHGGDIERVAQSLGVEADSLLDLSVTMNPFAPDVVAVVRRVAGAVKRYPDPARATAVFAEVLGVEPSRVLLTNGGAEAIALVAAHLESAVVVEPEFSLWRRHLSAVVGSETGALRVRSNPNNPTGVLARAEEVAGVWDEAFSPLSTGEWSRGDADRGAIVVGSLTKLFACPGLRLGYLIAPERDVVARLAARQAAWAVNGLALGVLPELLEKADLPRWAKELAAGRAALAERCASAGLVVHAAAAPGCSSSRRAGCVLASRATAWWCGTARASGFGAVRIALPDASGFENLRGALERAQDERAGDDHAPQERA